MTPQFSSALHPELAQNCLSYTQLSSGLAMAMCMTDSTQQVVSEGTRDGMLSPSTLMNIDLGSYLSPRPAPDGTFLMLLHGSGVGASSVDVAQFTRAGDAWTQIQTFADF